MSTTRSVESRVLDPVERLLESATHDLGLPGDTESRLFILEALACRLGGTDVRSLWGHDCRRVSASLSSGLGDWVERISEAIAAIPYHAALALCTLAQPHLSESKRRTTGAYYTDFRLANLVGEKVAERLQLGGSVVDLSSGTGILLVASVLQSYGDDHTAMDDCIVSRVFAGDISGQALRGTRLALISLLSDLSRLEELDEHLRLADTLDRGPELWNDIAPDGFDCVVGNPPWEKLSLTRHEFLTSNGSLRHYGSVYEDEAHDGFGSAQQEVKRRSQSLGQKYSHAAAGELDLYRAFLDLALQVVKPSGQVTMLVPAGLIRSKHCASLRQELLHRGGSLCYTIAENRARFFAIDTRFKFLVVDWQGKKRTTPIVVETVKANELSAFIGARTTFARSELRQMPIGLGVPEVRGDAERAVLRKILSAGVPMGDSALWAVPIVRELDMTRDRLLFQAAPSQSALPLIEGRMVQQYRNDAKEYVSGTGRRAKWAPVRMGTGSLVPQHWVELGDMPPAIANRVQRPRVGFCDITGQTNERSLMAARIPAGVVCGNKVPTILFESNEYRQDDLEDLWLGVVNSIPFDWFARRVVTTTFNYFIMQSLPMPKVSPDDEIGRRIISAVRRLSRILDANTDDSRTQWSLLRAEIDAQVAEAYGLTVAEIGIMLDDFPLLDRGQPAILGESHSTITRDSIVAAMAEGAGEKSESRTRSKIAIEMGATAYVPAEYAAL